MKLLPRYKKSLSAISLVALSLFFTFTPLSQAQESISKQQIVAQARTDRKAEADRLFNQGNQLYQVSKYQEALQSWEQALKLYRQIKDINGERYSLMGLGVVYHSLGKYQKAIENYQLALGAIAE